MLVTCRTVKGYIDVAADAGNPSFINSDHDCTCNVLDPSNRIWTMVQIISEKQIQTMFKLVFVMSLNCTGTLFHISKSFFSVLLIWYIFDVYWTHFQWQCKSIIDTSFIALAIRISIHIQQYTIHNFLLP